MTFAMVVISLLDWVSVAIGLIGKIGEEVAVTVETTTTNNPHVRMTIRCHSLGHKSRLCQQYTR